MQIGSPGLNFARGTQRAHPAGAPHARPCRACSAVKPAENSR